MKNISTQVKQIPGNSYTYDDLDFISNLCESRDLIANDSDLVIPYYEDGTPSLYPIPSILLEDIDDKFTIFYYQQPDIAIGDGGNLADWLSLDLFRQVPTMFITSVVAIISKELCELMVQDVYNKLKKHILKPRGNKGRVPVGLTVRINKSYYNTFIFNSFLTEDDKIQAFNQIHKTKINVNDLNGKIWVFDRSDGEWKEP